MLTHCNTGALAAVVGGTALGVLAELHRRGTLGGVVASETRPLLQGARLTAWELGRLGVDFRVAVDGAGPFLMARGDVDAVVVGADRICANGDTINKIGTYAHALGAAPRRHPVRGGRAGVHCGRLDTPTGADVEIEDRDGAEVVAGGRAVNPAFDVTPARAGDGDRHRRSGGSAGRTTVTVCRSGATAVTQPPARPSRSRASGRAGMSSGLPGCGGQPVRAS